MVKVSVVTDNYMIYSIIATGTRYLSSVGHRCIKQSPICYRSPIRVSKTVSFLPWQGAKPLRLIKFINRLAVAKSYIDYCTKTPHTSVQFPHGTMEILSYAKVQYLAVSIRVPMGKYCSLGISKLKFAATQIIVCSHAN